MKVIANEDGRGVLVVGASAAGLTTVEALRRKGYRAASPSSAPSRTRPTTGRHCPNRCSPASGTPNGLTCARRRRCPPWTPSSSSPTRPSAWTRPTRTVRTASGRALRADAVVVATGLRPRTLPGQADLAGVHVLRTLDDALALRADLLASSRLVVVGEGVLGTEIAATARAMGLERHHGGPSAGPHDEPGRAPGRGTARRTAHRARGPPAARHRGQRGCPAIAGTRHRRASGHRRGPAGRRGRGGDRRDPATEWLAGSGLRTSTTAWSATPAAARRRASTRSATWPAGTTTRLGRLAPPGEPDQRHRTGRRPSRPSSSATTGRTARALLLDRPVRRQDPGARGAARRRRGDRNRRRPGEPPLRRSLPPATAGSPAYSAGTCPNRPAYADRRSSTHSPPRTGPAMTAGKGGSAPSSATTAESSRPTRRPFSGGSAHQCLPRTRCGSRFHWRNQ